MPVLCHTLTKQNPPFCRVPINSIYGFISRKVLDMRTYIEFIETLQNGGFWLFKVGLSLQGGTISQLLGFSMCYWYLQPSGNIHKDGYPPSPRDTPRPKYRRRCSDVLKRGCYAGTAEPSREGGWGSYDYDYDSSSLINQTSNPIQTACCSVGLYQGED